MAQPVLKTFEIYWYKRSTGIEIKRQLRKWSYVPDIHRDRQYRGSTRGRPIGDHQTEAHAGQAPHSVAAGFAGFHKLVWRTGM